MFVCVFFVLPNAACAKGCLIFCNTHPKTPTHNTTTQEARPRMLQWLAGAIESNNDRAKMQVNSLVTASSGFAVNVSVVLLKFCEPFLDPNNGVLVVGWVVDTWGWMCAWWLYTLHGMSTVISFCIVSVIHRLHILPPHTCTPCTDATWDKLEAGYLFSQDARITTDAENDTKLAATAAEEREYVQAQGNQPPRTKPVWTLFTKTAAFV